MGEFRMGRKFAQAFYPEPRGTGSGGGFSSNYASGPDGNTDITASGVEIPWGTILAGPSSGEEIRITPINTGILAIDGVIAVANFGNDTASAQVVVRVDGVGMVVPNDLQITAEGLQFSTIRFSLVTPPLTLNVAHQVSVFLLADTEESLILNQNTATIKIQEINAATG